MTKHVTGRELKEVGRHRVAAAQFLGKNLSRLDRLTVREKIELQALELLYVSAYTRAFGTEPAELPTRRSDQAFFLIETAASPANCAA